MVLAATLSFVLRAHADDDMPVPIDLQAELLSKVTAYDRGAAGRAGQVVHVLLVAKHGDPSSMPAVLQMRQALTRVGLFGSLSHVEQVIEYTNAAALADMCRSQNAAIVYFGPGFRDDVASIRVALESVTTLTVAAQPADVPRGIVLGFDLVSGRPKLLYQLTQARKQHVDLKADVLKLMRIYE
jgi:hypothetical protein